MKITGMSFEEAVRKLEEIAARLEGENVDLDSSLKLYEEGISLVRYCNAMLDKAERKIKMLSVSGDGELEEMFRQADPHTYHIISHYHY